MNEDNTQEDIENAIDMTEFYFDEVFKYGDIIKGVLI